MSYQTEDQALALQAGYKITRDEAEWIIWERTGYPCFFMSDNPYTEMLEQARQYVNGEYSCGRCGAGMESDDGGFNLCDACTTVMERPR